VIWLFVLGVHIFALVKMKSAMQVSKRSIRCASGYLGACSASYGVFTISLLVPALYGQDYFWTDIYGQSNWFPSFWDWFDFFGWRFLFFNGFFNS